MTNKGNSKLAPHEVKHIYAEMKTVIPRSRSYVPYNLARQYRIGVHAVWQIKRKYTWRNLTDEIDDDQGTV